MSNLKEISIADASDSQLRDYAKIFLGLEIHHNAGRAKIIATMQDSGFNKDMIEYKEPAEADLSNAYQPSGPTEASMKDAPKDKPKHVFLKIHNAQEEKENHPVPIGVNGKVMYVPRGKYCRVPYSYYEALKHAQITTYAATEQDGLGAATTVSQYPFDVQLHEPNVDGAGI